MNDVKIINNFLDEEDIVFLTKYIDKNYLDTEKFRQRTGIAFGKGLAFRAVFPDEKPASMFKELETVLNKYSYKFIEECKLFFPDQGDIFFQGFSVTRLSEDIQLRIHSDVHYGLKDFLVYSGIFYLNDDYEGGEIAFLDNYDITEKDYVPHPVTGEKVLFPLYEDHLGGFVYKPKRGDLVIFPSLKYHGGKVISGGHRDSIILWATLNKSYEFEGFDSDRVIRQD